MKFMSCCTNRKHKEPPPDILLLEIHKRLETTTNAMATHEHRHDPHPAWDQYLAAGREMFLREVLVGKELMQATENFSYLYVDMEGPNAVVWPERDPTTGFSNENRPNKRILKRAFIKNRAIRENIVRHYLALGFSFVDIVCLYRHKWYIIAHE